MGAAYFYHLTRSDAAQTLRMLLPKALAAGWQVELRLADEVALGPLDAALWLPDESFLPHGPAGGPHDDLQPVLLSAPGRPAPAPRACVMGLGGAEISAEEAAAAERVCILFDGHDSAAVARARDQWRALTGAGIAAQYWAQENGWEKKAESAGAG